MEVVGRLKIRNSLGLHARAAAKIVEMADRYESQLTLEKDGRQVDGSNILSILTLACPKELAPDDEIFQAGTAVLEERLNLVHDPREAVADADIIYTDTWVSMGEDEKRQKKIKLLEDFQVNDDLLKVAPDAAKVMHCLPAHRGEEITDSVMDGDRSVVFLQAHNRLHVQKAIMDILNQRREEAK